MLESFLIACLLMGLGIGIDVAIATAVRTQSLRQQNMTCPWISGVTLTHTLFPMIGYLLTHFSLQSLPTITPIVGIIASGLIAWFLYNELFSGEEEAEGQQLMVTVGIILAVSWDALWSGPAKSAQVVGWNEWLIWLSFLLVGLVVMAFSITAYKLATIFCNASHLKNSGIILLQWVQYSVIGYFGLLALIRYTFNSNLSIFLIFILAAIITLILMVFSFSRYPLQRS